TTAKAAAALTALRQRWPGQEQGQAQNQHILAHTSHWQSSKKGGLNGKGTWFDFHDIKEAKGSLSESTVNSSMNKRCKESPLERAVSRKRPRHLSTRRNKRPLRWSCGTVRGPLLLQQPVPDFRVIVGFRPRIVAGVWIESEFDVPSAVIFQGLDHALRSVGKHDVVLGAMEDPDG